MQQVNIPAAPLEVLALLLPAERWFHLKARAAHAHDLLAARVVWNVSATAEGGGVAEMLHTLLAYGRGAGVDLRWLVLDGDPEFFAITKRIHNALHGSEEGGHELGAAEHEHYERVLRGNLAELTSLVRPGDIVLLHDPQTAGLVEGMRAAGVHVVWRCHIGRDDPTAATERGWAFLRGYLANADAFVFSRREYIPSWAEFDRVRVIAPSIDPFSAKNRELDDVEVDSVLRQVGLIAGRDGIPSVEFTRRDGSTAVVRRHTHLMSGPPPPRRGPLGRAGQSMGPAQGHGRCAVGLRGLHRAGHTGCPSDPRGPGRLWRQRRSRRRTGPC